MRKTEFEDKVGQRRGRLSLFDGLATTMRAALGYKNKMSDAFSGADLQRAHYEIEDAVSMVAQRKGQVWGEIEDLKSRLGVLNGRIRSLQYEYRNCGEDD